MCLREGVSDSFPKSCFVREDFLKPFGVLAPFAEGVYSPSPGKGLRRNSSWDAEGLLGLPFLAVWCPSQLAVLCTYIRDANFFVPSLRGSQSGPLFLFFVRTDVRPVDFFRPPVFFERPRASC